MTSHLKGKSIEVVISPRYDDDGIVGKEIVNRQDLRSSKPPNEKGAGLRRPLRASEDPPCHVSSA
jgi:hypothetical protein